MKAIRSYMGILVALAAVLIFFSFEAQNFFTVDTLSNVFVQGASISLLAAALTLVVLLGEIDLSVAAVQSACGACVAALMVKAGFSTAPAVGLAILLGALFGLVNGHLVQHWRIPSFVVTLAILGIAQGLSLLLTDASTISGFPESFVQIDHGHILGIAVPVLIAGVAYLALWLLLTQTSFGTAIYAIGGSRSAAERAGIPVSRVTVIAFVISGALAATAGLIVAAQVGAVNSNIGASDLLDAIAIVVIGGASLNGGAGTIGRTLAAAFIIVALNNGLVLIGIDPYWKEIVIGLAIVTAVAIDNLVGRGLRPERPDRGDGPRLLGIPLARKVVR